MILALHLMVTISHIGLPVDGEPYFRAQQVTLYSAIANLVLMLIIFTSCKSFTSLATFFTSGNILGNITYKRFFRLHTLFWGLLGASIIIHIVSGMIHAINT
jgi:quinol-cytochrome oxidoreductase complex cytochrome b subunit